MVLALIAASSTALTGITPSSSLSKIPQFTFGAIDPRTPAPNLMTAVMSAEVASNASNLLMDIKPGYMLGAKPRQQAIGHVIGIRRLREIIDRTELHGRYRSRDVAIACQYNGTSIRPHARELCDHIKTCAVFETHINNCECRRLGTDQLNALSDRMAETDFKASRLHGSHETLQKRAIIIDDHERAVGGQFILLERQVFGGQGNLRGSMPHYFVLRIHNPTPLSQVQPLVARKTASKGYFRRQVPSNLIVLT